MTTGAHGSIIRGSGQTRLCTNETWGSMVAYRLFRSVSESAEIMNAFEFEPGLNAARTPT